MAAFFFCVFFGRCSRFYGGAEKDEGAGDQELRDQQRPVSDILDTIFEHKKKRIVEEHPTNMMTK